MTDPKPSVTPPRSVAFETLKPAVVGLSNEDRVYMRTWLLKFTKVDGSIVAPISSHTQTRHRSRR